MLFQALDDKSECVGIYCNGQLHFDKEGFPDDLTATWKYASYLKDIPGIQYASLYVQGKKMEDVIPDYLKEDWEAVASKLLSFQRSLSIGKIDLGSHCLFDLIPQRFLSDFCEVKNNITKHVLENYPKPSRYEYLLRVCEMLEDIENRKININKTRLQQIKQQGPPDRRLSDLHPYIRYNQFGTRTGRLSTRSRSFPILTLPKKHRCIIESHNDYFLELDFNGAEVRVLLGLLGLDQPTEDVHTFHSEQVFGGEKKREEVKTAFFAWLYGSKSSETRKFAPVLEKFYSKDKILDQFWDGKKIYTPYRKVINDVDEHHALNYIVQSTCAELTLLQALKIKRFLKTRGSSTEISCIIHDAIVLDFSHQDLPQLQDILRLMSSTKFGDFKVNLSRGKNLGDMKEMNI